MSAPSPFASSEVVYRVRFRVMRFSPVLPNGRSQSLRAHPLWSFPQSAWPPVIPLDITAGPSGRTSEPTLASEMLENRVAQRDPNYTHRESNPQSPVDYPRCRFITPNITHIERSCRYGVCYHLLKPTPRSMWLFKKEGDPPGNRP